MCDELQEAVESATQNIQHMADAIDALPITTKFKVRFLELADNRGFRFTDDNLETMEEIGKTDSDICFLMLEGKEAGLINAYLLATELDDEKQRADAVTFLREASKKKSITKEDMWKAIATVRKGAGGLFDE